MKLVYDNAKTEEKEQMQKSSTAKKIGIGCAVAVLILVLLVFALYGCSRLMLSGTDTEKTEETTQTAQTSKAGDSSKANTSVKASKETKTDFTVGETLDDDGVKITLNRVSVWAGSEYETPPEGKEFLVMNWSIVNDSEKDYSPMTTSRTVYVDGAATDSAITLYDGEILSFNTLIPGTHTSGDLVYEVPIGWSEILVKVDTILGDECTYTITPEQVQ